jgi:hypothetical protein
MALFTFGLRIFCFSFRHFLVNSLIDKFNPEYKNRSNLKMNDNFNNNQISGQKEKIVGNDYL